MKRFILITALLFGFICSCKKKKAAEPVVAPAKSDSLTVSPTSPSPFAGYFITGTYTTISTNGISVFEKSNVRFFTQALSSLYNSNNVKVNSVYLNGNATGYVGVGGYVFEFSGTGTNFVDTWYVTGDAGGYIPTFSFANTNPFPGCSNIDALPDSISRSHGYTLVLNNVSSLNWGVLRFGSVTTFNLASGTNTLKITPAMLASVTLGTHESLDLQLQYGVTAKRSGKYFRFVKELQVIKPVKIVY